MSIVFILLYRALLLHIFYEFTILHNQKINAIYRGLLSFCFLVH